MYSADDSDVAPPTLVLPQLARTMPTGAGSSSPAAVIELLVNEAGMVETVKVLNKPERFPQGMLLSAMKAWRYHPALKEGRAVRYAVRVTVPI